MGYELLEEGIVHGMVGTITHITIKMDNFTDSYFGVEMLTGEFFEGLSGYNLKLID